LERPATFTPAQKEDASCDNMAVTAHQKSRPDRRCSDRQCHLGIERRLSSDLRKRRETWDGIEAQIHRLSSRQKNPTKCNKAQRLAIAHQIT